MKVLVVDDSEDCRELTEAALRSGGHDTLPAATSAADAFERLEIGRPGQRVPVDAILLDVVMPDVDGIAACARIRSDDRYRDVPIIMVTSLADGDSLAHAFSAGANDYMAKPIDRVEMLVRLDAAYRTRSEIERLRRRERELLDRVAGR